MRFSVLVLSIVLTGSSSLVLAFRPSSLPSKEAAASVSDKISRPPEIEAAGAAVEIKSSSGKETCSDGFAFDIKEQSCKKIYCKAKPEISKDIKISSKDVEKKSKDVRSGKDVKLKKQQPQKQITSASLSATNETYNSKSKCWEKIGSPVLVDPKSDPKTDTTSCEKGLALKDIKGKKQCLMNLCDSTMFKYDSTAQLQTQAFSKTEMPIFRVTLKDSFFNKEFNSSKNCFVISLKDGACPKDFKVSKDKKACEEDSLEPCKRQPSPKHATAFTDNFIYEAKDCIIEHLPTDCEEGYALDDPETDRAKCKAGSKSSRRN